VPRPMLHILTRGLLAAMVLAVLAPSVSRVLAAERKAGDWVQICTAQGMEWVQLGDRPAPGDIDDPLAMRDLCGHCVLTAERFAPLLPTWPVWQAGDGEPVHASGDRLSDIASSAVPPLARGPP
jgi:hypothetical protein